MKTIWGRSVGFLCLVLLAWLQVPSMYRSSLWCWALLHKRNGGHSDLEIPASLRNAWNIFWAESSTMSKPTCVSSIINVTSENVNSLFEASNSRIDVSAGCVWKWPFVQLPVVPVVQSAGWGWRCACVCVSVYLSPSIYVCGPFSYVRCIILWSTLFESKIIRHCVWNWLLSKQIDKSGDAAKQMRGANCLRIDYPYPIFTGTLTFLLYF